MIIRCKNMTHAMKARKLLEQNDISAMVEKINNDPDVNGCIYSIVFDDIYYDEAMAIMQNGNVILHKSEKNKYGEWDL